MLNPLHRQAWMGSPVISPWAKGVPQIGHFSGMVHLSGQEGPGPEPRPGGLLGDGPLGEPCGGQDFVQVVNVEAVAHASVVVDRLERRDVAVAVVVAGDRAVQHPICDHLAAGGLEFDDLVAVVGLAAISVVHGVPFQGVGADQQGGRIRRVDRCGSAITKMTADPHCG